MADLLNSTKKQELLSSYNFYNSILILWLKLQYTDYCLGFDQITQNQLFTCMTIKVKILLSKYRIM